MGKKLFTLISIWSTAISFFSSAQSYSEKVEVNINTDFLITGETLYYSIYCLEAGQSKPSTLSKLVYVELIGENEKPFLQTKVPLIEGRGAGDFFLPSTLPSGNYTLLAYTKWMRNFSLEHFFQKQITIINPYLKPFSSEIKSNDDKSTNSHFSNKNETSQVHLVPDKRKYSQRQKVVVSVKNNDPTHDCRISLNVHRHYKNVNSKAGDTNQGSSESPVKDEVVTFLPDLRGETIGGVVQESVSNKSVANTNIYLSAMGPGFEFQVSKTDSVGRFYFITNNIQTQTGIQFQVDRPSDSLPFEVILDSEFVNDYRKFKPLPLSIDTSLRKEIEQRNVYSQIENAYFIKKRDSILDSTKEPFFGKPDKVYKLDDFTRFPTMEDIFREYVYEVVVSKRDGKFALRLINTNSKRGSQFLNAPLLLVDGIPVFDTEILMNYNPLLIKTVSLITRQYVYAGILYDGILSVNTYTGIAKDLPIKSIQKEYTSWQNQKSQYSPTYKNENLSRIPDYRVQLFWNPSINLEPGQELIVEFYTSDIEGEFLIEAKGFNSIGEVVSVRDTIEVRK